MQRSLYIFFLLFSIGKLSGQSGAGGNLFTFSSVANGPQLQALGGVNVSQQSNDIGMAFHNPALLRPAMHGQAHFVFHSYLGGIKAYHSQWGVHNDRLNTDFALGVQWFDYGTIEQTDASGNVSGALRPYEQQVQISASRSYMRHWHYGLSLKFLRSSYGIYRSSAVAMDAGVSYTDSLNGWQMGMTLFNMGTVTQKFQGTEAGSLPFDIRVGISKKLKNAPLQFSATWHNLHRFNLLQDIPSNDPAFPQKAYAFADQLLSHLVFSGQLMLGGKIECTLAYNFLRRRELNAGTEGAGLNGFSIGMGMLLKRWQLRYSRSYYMAARSANMLGITLSVFK